MVGYINAHLYPHIQTQRGKLGTWSTNAKLLTVLSRDGTALRNRVGEETRKEGRFSAFNLEIHVLFELL